MRTPSSSPGQSNCGLEVLPCPAQGPEGRTSTLPAFFPEAQRTNRKLGETMGKVCLVMTHEFINRLPFLT